MSTDINLVGNKAPIDPRIKRLLKARKVSFLVLFIICFLAIILFLVNLRLSVNSLQKEQTAVIEELSSYDQSSAKIFLFNERVRDISSIMSARENYAELLDKTLARSPVNVTNLQIQGEGFTVTVSSLSLLTLNEFLTNILTLSDEKKLSNITLDSLLIEDGLYIMTIKAQII